MVDESLWLERRVQRKSEEKLLYSGEVLRLDNVLSDEQARVVAIRVVIFSNVSSLRLAPLSN